MTSGRARCSLCSPTRRDHKSRLLLLCVELYPRPLSQARVDGGTRLKLRGRGFPTGGAAAALVASARFSWYACAEETEAAADETEEAPPPRRGSKSERRGEKADRKAERKRMTRKRVLHTVEVPATLLSPLHTLLSLLSLLSLL